jgi:hypothetical protein
LIQIKWPSLRPAFTRGASWSKLRRSEVAMSDTLHPLAPHHLPPFITAPGETDILFNVMVGVVILSIVLLGVFYFRLHALPEHMAHKGQKFQYEIVAVLGLLSLFTHNHAYWIAGLLLAFVPIPDFSTPLSGMAASLARIAASRSPAVEVEPAPAPLIQVEPAPPPLIDVQPTTPPPPSSGDRRMVAVKAKELHHA